MIKIENLSHTYKNKNEETLKNINLNIKKGEIAALIGPSGSGKSTLINCIGRLVIPTSGRILINNKDILKANKKEIREIRKKIGFIFQEFNLIERDTVFKNVLNGRLSYCSTLKSCFNKFSENDYRIVEGSLRDVGLLDLKDERVCNLSGGQKQRTAIARALSQEPEIILADEPVSNLDPKLVREILYLLQKNCREKGITLIISIHFAELVKEYFDRMMGIVEGKILFDDEFKDNVKEELIKSRLKQLGYIE